MTTCMECSRQVTVSRELRGTDGKPVGSICAACFGQLAGVPMGVAEPDEQAFWPCPRCLAGDVVEHDGFVVTAVSRADDRTDVCDRCGVDEANREFATGGIVPISEWPLSLDEARAFVPRLEAS